MKIIFIFFSYHARRFIVANTLSEMFTVFVRISSEAEALKCEFRFQRPSYVSLNRVLVDTEIKWRTGGGAGLRIRIRSIFGSGSALEKKLDSDPPYISSEALEAQIRAVEGNGLS